MGSSAELTLNCGPSVTSASNVFKSFSLVGDHLEKMSRHEEYIKGLEEERSKIEAFKRELPFCMQLLNDAIDACKEQLAECERTSPHEDVQNAPNTSGRPVLEEFIPIKKSSQATENKPEENHVSKKARFNNGDKPNWMISANLWNPDPETIDSRKGGGISMEESLKKQDSQHQVHSLPSNAKLFSDSKHRVRGAFQPFSKESHVIAPRPVRSTVERTLPNLALSSAEREVDSSLVANETVSLNATTTTNNRISRSKETKEVHTPVHEKETVSVIDGTNTSPTTPNTSPAQTQRKSRRCWSPELHRRFINALHQLGGSQVATPKQIRELMKVDGLTNDEVKSHLQKFRLHTRRPSPSPPTSNPQAPQLVVVGGIWVPPEYAAHAAAAAQQGQGGLYNPIPTTVSCPPLSHYCQPSISQGHEYYCQINPAASKSQLHHSVSLYCDQQQEQRQQTPSQSQNSPQGPFQCNGQSSGARGTSADAGREESVGKDAESDSSSWKAEDYVETTEVMNMGRGLSLRKQPHKFLDEDDGDAADNRARDQTGKQALVGR